MTDIPDFGDDHMHYIEPSPLDIVGEASASLITKEDPVEAKAGFVKSLLKKSEELAKSFNELHWGKKTAIIGGTVALGATIGYWAFQSKSENQRGEAQHSK